MAITRTPMVDDDGSGTTGTVVNNTWKTELYNQIDAALPVPPAQPLGTWIDFTPTFTADAGASITLPGLYGCAYVLIGKLLTVSLHGYLTITGGPPAHLYFNLPAGLSASGARSQVIPAGFSMFDAMGQVVGLVVLGNSVTRFDIQRTFTGATWSGGGGQFAFCATVSIA